MSRAKKDNKIVTFSIKTEVAEAIDNYSKQSHLSKTAIVEIAVEKYLTELQSSNPILTE